MTIAFQLRDIRESVYRWLEEEIHWQPGGERWGNVILDKYWRRVQALKTLLSKEYPESARDVRIHWESAVSQLNDDELYGLLNTTYRDKLITPWDVCCDRWPENGPDSVSNFLHSLGVLMLQFPESCETPAKTNTEDQQTAGVQGKCLDFATAESKAPPEFLHGPLTASAASFARALSKGTQESKEWLLDRHGWKWYFVRQLGARTVDIHFKTAEDFNRAFPVSSENKKAKAC